MVKQQQSLLICLISGEDRENYDSPEKPALAQFSGQDWMKGDHIETLLLIDFLYQTLKHVVKREL